MTNSGLANRIDYEIQKHDFKNKLKDNGINIEKNNANNPVNSLKKGFRKFKRNRKKKRAKNNR